MFAKTLQIMGQSANLNWLAITILAIQHESFCRTIWESGSVFNGSNHVGWSSG